MRRKPTVKQSLGIALATFLMLANYSPQMQAVRDLPDTMQMRTGEVHALSIGWPFSLSTADEDMYVLASSAESVGVISDREGVKSLKVSAFGIPVRNVSISVAPEYVLYPGGQSIGAALNTKGVLVVGTSDLSEKNPAKEAGIKEGDMILSVNGQEIQGATHLTEVVAKSPEGALKVLYSREGRERTCSLTPVKDKVDGRMRLGLWVRDSTAGVGTLSFFDPQTQYYGALGHAISDVDTGITLPVKEGNVLRSTVVGIRKGEKGNPGELQGSFLRDQQVLGDIRLNNSLGIFGKIDAPMVNPLYPDGLPIASQAKVRIGPATILTTLDGEGVKEYQVEIVRVARQASAAQKSMTLKVTDPTLLERTGGIVQGMSGSPILQDGRIVGAVTHVFVNDPTQGYGVFIEWMLEQTQQSKAA